MSSCGFTKSAMDRLMKYKGPGNVRELMFQVERAAREAEGEPISSYHLSLLLDEAHR